MTDVELSWTDNSTFEDGFRVYRTTVPVPSFPADFTQIDTLPPGAAEYVDRSAPADAAVSYAVTAFSTQFGESDAATASVTTPPVDARKYIGLLGATAPERSVAGAVRAEQAASGQTQTDRASAGAVVATAPTTGQTREERTTAGEVSEETPSPGDTDREED